jgi:hypothetical protein
MRERSQCPTHQGQLALHNARRRNQTQAPISGKRATRALATMPRGYFVEVTDLNDMAALRPPGHVYPDPDALRFSVQVLAWCVEVEPGTVIRPGWYWIVRKGRRMFAQTPLAPSDVTKARVSSVCVSFENARWDDRGQAVPLTA